METSCSATTSTLMGNPTGPKLQGLFNAYPYSIGLFYGYYGK